jgi:DNA topoisomerase-1
MTASAQVRGGQVADGPVERIEPEDIARSAGLRYMSDDMPGIRRRRAGRGFIYLTADGTRVTDDADLARIKALVIPPAWSDVWISSTERGHIQATGRDARGRKQYRYHPTWREVRDENKYGRMVQFGESLPPIRRRTGRDLSKPRLPKERVLAAVVRLLDSTLIRVGNVAYAKENRSFGLTTLRDRHVEVSGSSLRFRFRAKGGKEYTGELQSPRLASLVKRCQDLPGQELFQYIDEDGEIAAIESSDVNAYLGDITGQEFTAKDFRTWGGTVYASQQLREVGPFDSDAEAKRNVAEAIKGVAKQLGNTPAVCRACYIHPGLIEAYVDGSLLSVWDRTERSIKDWPRGLKREEAVLLVVLRHHIACA